MAAVNANAPRLTTLHGVPSDPHWPCGAPAAHNARACRMMRSPALNCMTSAERYKRSKLSWSSCCSKSTPCERADCIAMSVARGSGTRNLRNRHGRESPKVCATSLKCADGKERMGEGRRGQRKTAGATACVVTAKRTRGGGVARLQRLEDRLGGVDRFTLLYVLKDPPRQRPQHSLVRLTNHTRLWRCRAHAREERDESGERAARSADHSLCARCDPALRASFRHHTL
eukprot:7167573-Prymnesium_polylepis.2